MDRHYRSQEDPRESISIALRVQLRLPLTPGVAVRVCVRRQEGEKRGDSRLDKTGLARQIVRDRLTSLFDSIKTSRRGLRPPRNFDRPTTEHKRRFFAAVGDSRRFLGVWSSDAVSRGWLSSVINGSTVSRRSQDNVDYFSFFFFFGEESWRSSWNRSRRMVSCIFWSGRNFCYLLEIARFKDFFDFVVLDRFESLPLAAILQFL